jgi:hypothetical protein
MIANSTNLTKCYTNNVSGTIDLSLAYAPDDLACQKCGSTAFARDMILCDGCPHAWHYWCLDPPLSGVPDDDIWLCHGCKASGLRVEDVDLRRQTQALVREEAAEYRAFKREANPSVIQKRKDAENAAMQGRLVRKETAAGTLWGRIHYRGPRDGRRPYLAVYQDGSEEICGNQAMAKRKGWLMRKGTKLPSSVRIPAPSSELLAAAAMVSNMTGWDLSTEEGVSSAVQALMPGSWTDEEVEQLRSSYVQLQLQQPAVMLASSALLPLLRLLDVPHGVVCLDPFAASGLLVDVGRMHGLEMIGNDVNAAWGWSLQHDALGYELYEAVDPQIVITSPPASVLDLAVPFLASVGALVTCVLLPTLWVTDSSLARGRWLAALQRQGRLAVVTGLIGMGGTQGAWVLIFSSPTVKLAMLRAHIPDVALLDC